MSSIRNLILSNLSAVASRNINAGVACAAGLLMTSSALLAHDTTAGSTTSGDIFVTSDQNWTVLRTASIFIPEGDVASHTCAVTAAADFDDPGFPGIVSRYRYVVTRNDSSPPTGTAEERSLELGSSSLGVGVPGTKPVATVGIFLNLTRDNGIDGTGLHTFRSLGRKENASSIGTPVLDSGIVVSCTDGD